MSRRAMTAEQLDVIELLANALRQPNGRPRDLSTTDHVIGHLADYCAESPTAERTFLDLVRDRRQQLMTPEDMQAQIARLQRSRDTVPFSHEHRAFILDEYDRLIAGYQERILQIQIESAHGG